MKLEVSRIFKPLTFFGWETPISFRSDLLFLVSEDEYLLHLDDVIKIVKLHDEATVADGRVIGTTNGKRFELRGEDWRIEFQVKGPPRLYELVLKSSKAPGGCFSQRLSCDKDFMLKFPDLIVYTNFREKVANFSYNKVVYLEGDLAQSPLGVALGVILSYCYFDVLIDVGRHI